ncbi:MAG: hypothetical protein EPO28_17220 [Saprospiraceae bacterium]|nr:MAG: hypothetical protein EPO28_17220 [Saprospiraceae bacterium]
MKNSISIPIGVCVLLVYWLAAYSCTNDELPLPPHPAACDTLEVTYTNLVKDIIDNSCAYTGCHLTGSSSGATGDFSTFGGIAPYLESGSFRDRVVNQKEDPISGMPPNSTAYPESQKDTLTEEELIVIQCWLYFGYPEK